MNGKPLTFILKTSFDCNFACTYCYEGHRASMGRMSLQTVTNVIEQAAQYIADKHAHVTFVWHGGEPLLMGQDFYRQVVGLQKKRLPHFRYSNMLQTNGLLLDDAFAKLLGKNKFAVGVSLDGPADIHDAGRPTKAGAATFTAAFGALKRMQAFGGPIGALAIYTRRTHDNIDRFYSFCRDNKFPMRINPLLLLGNAKDDGKERLQITPQEYGEALVHLFNRWIAEPRYTFMFEPFHNLVRSIASGRLYNCSFAGQCASFLKIFPNGDAYFCGRHNDEKDRLGNINSDNLDAFLTSPKRAAYAATKAAVKEICGDCAHVDICNGGCTRAAPILPDGRIGRDASCESYKMLLDHMKTIIPRGLTVRGMETQAPAFAL